MYMARKSVARKAITRGRDLTHDSVGTVQLLDENDLNQLFNTGDVVYDKKLYSDYKQNLRRQKNIVRKHFNVILYGHSKTYI